MLKCLNKSNKLLLNVCVNRSYSLYTQGQKVDKKIREYFYYIDHEGMVIYLKFPKYL